MRDSTRDALAYAELGWTVVPLHAPSPTAPCDCNRPNCPSPAKHPRITDWVRNASAEAAEVERWWGMWPAANVGIATGPVSGIVVLDIDPRHGGDEELIRLVGEHGLLPHGPAAETGGGGQHYYFRHPGGKVLSRTIAPGVDVKGDGGQVVAPPSVHVTGAPYAWYDDSGPDWPLPDIPAWLLLLMQSAPDTAFEGMGEVPETISTGSRNNTLTSLGGTMRNRGMSQRAIFAALLAENAEKCQPPLSENEVATIAASVARYIPAPEPPPVIVDIGTRKPAARSTKRDPYVPATFTAAELMARQLPDVRWAVPDLLPEGLALLAGKPKLGKSWMAFNLGIAIAQGGVVMGAYPADDGDVLILALEDNPRRLQSRLKKMLMGELPPERLHMETQWPREDEGGVDVLDVWLGRHPETRMVVIDTLAKFRPIGVDAKYADDYAAITGLQTLAGTHGVAIVLVTHYRKATTDDWLDNVTGTLGIAGAADTIIGLERPRGAVGMTSAILRITGRDIEEKDLALTWDMMTAQWSVLGDADEYQMGRETAALIDLLKEIGGPAKLNDIATRLGKKRNTTSNLLSRATSAGLIKSFGGGMYGCVNEQ